MSAAPSNLCNYELQATFPNTENSLEIFLTKPLPNSSGEKHFSVLRRVKTFLRNILCYNKNPASRAQDYDVVIIDIVK